MLGCMSGLRKGEQLQRWQLPMARVPVLNWKGDVILTLDNGETIRLKDSIMKGHIMQPGAYTAGCIVPDLYQRYSAYFLSPEECEMLKQHSVMLVSYFLDDKYDKGVQYLEVDDSRQALKAQLVAIGK